ncbi:hypothetical protein [Actinomadura graeca]|nr:hypothetical protein [Actinomadura graeca]
MSSPDPVRPVPPPDVPAKIVASVPTTLRVEPADKLVYPAKAGT